MAKKRKASAATAAEDRDRGPNMDVGSSRKRIRTYEDVANSDDEFHINRDEILLEEAPSAKRRRRVQEEEEFLQPSDEEVLGLSDEGDEDEDEDEFDEVEQYGRNGSGASGRGVGTSEEEDEDAIDDEEGVGWGMAKDEIYGADEIETEEQAQEELNEGLRLQRKELQGLEADFGFDEDEWLGKPGDGLEGGKANVAAAEVLELHIDEDATPAEKSTILKQQYPEFELLSREWLSLRDEPAALAKHISGREHDMPNMLTKLRAASAYLGALTMYLSLLSSTAATAQPNVVALPSAKLRDHPIMETIVRCRGLWQRARTLSADPTPAANNDTPTSMPNDIVNRANGVSKQNVKQTAPKKSRAQKHAEAAQAVAQARKAERMQRTEADLANLDTLIKQSAMKSKRMQTNDGEDSDMGEEAPLTAQEAAEKAKHKKSLRFYTSQIAQKASKRGTAGRNAGGDEDIPYRERLKDRQARLNAQAQKKGQAGAELGDISDEEDARQARAIREEGDEYYDTIAAKTAKKKADKTAFAEAQRQAALQGGRVVEEEVVGPDGKRRVTYAIEKNKGLTPHRKKESRNPRVKKRKKFEEKKKKLGSIKPVFKGGEGRGGYKGEMTGIKKGLVKSTKL